MGALFSRFRWKRTPSPGAEVNEEQKDESTSEKDGVQVPSSPSQDTVVTLASSGSDKLQESPSKSEAPLACEEESFHQQASPVVKEAKAEAKEGDDAKTGDTEAPEPEVKELQRVNETKLEKEKTVDTSGVTTEKTVYTQVSESVKIQETKGPAVDPFTTSQKTVFPPFSKSWYETKPQATVPQDLPSYVHSVKVTESSHSSPSSPVSISEPVTPEKAQPTHQIAESISEKVEETVKTEVIEIATEAVEKLNDIHSQEPETEQPKVVAPTPVIEEQLVPTQEETSANEPEIAYEEQVGDDGERDVEGAVVKIQAGIRGYLTRKALKESRKDGPLMQSENGSAPVQPSSKQEVPTEEPLVLSAEEAAVTDSKDDDDERDAAVKIQSVYRGYRTRKQLDELINAPYEEEVDQLLNEPNNEEIIEMLHTGAEKVESPSQEIRRSPPDRSPVTVTENFVPILKAQVTITPPSSPTSKKQFNVTSTVETEEPKTSPVPEPPADTLHSETSDTEMPEDEENKEQAATKIQAAFRGYKVRKVSKKEASGKVKEIIDQEFDPEGVNAHRESSPQVLDDTPLDLENDEDTLELEDDDEADDNDEIPNVQWQTSELYTDDEPKHEPKTESITEEPTAPVSDSAKATRMSSEQVIFSTAKITLDGSRGSAMTSTAEEQVKSDH